MDDTEITGRATEIQTGAIPLENNTVTLNIPRPTLKESESASQASPWNLAELLGQWKLVETIPVVANTVGEIWSFRHTWRNVHEMHFRSLKSLFPLKSWRLHFLIQFRSNFQQVGMFTLAYTNIPKPLQSYLIGPRNKTETTQSSISDFHLMTQLPHTFIMMGEDHDLNVSLDWNSPFTSSIDGSYYNIWRQTANDREDLHNDYDMGTVMLHVTHKMQTVGDQNMSVRIWSRLSEVTYAGYSPVDNLL